MDAALRRLKSASALTSTIGLCGRTPTHRQAASPNLKAEIPFQSSGSMGSTGVVFCSDDPLGSSSSNRSSRIRYGASHKFQRNTRTNTVRIGANENRSINFNSSIARSRPRKNKPSPAPITGRMTPKQAVLRLTPKNDKVSLKDFPQIRIRPSYTLVLIVSRG